MKKALKRIEYRIWHYDNKGKKIEGAHSGIRGDLSGIRGDLTDIRGDLSGIRGDLTDITGNLTGITGNLSDCKITEEERKKGISVDDLVI